MMICSKRGVFNCSYVDFNRLCQVTMESLDINYQTPDGKPNKKVETMKNCHNALPGMVCRVYVKAIFEYSSLP